jgi:hypothetical protein
MDFRQRDWNELFSTKSGEAYLPPPQMSAPSGALRLEDLWAQSISLREHALQVRAASMEVRAIARDMRLRLRSSQDD